MEEEMLMSNLFI